MEVCARTSAPRHRLVGDPSTLLMTLCCALALSIHMAPARAVEACRGEAPIVTQGSVERAALSEAEVLAMRVARSADITEEGTPVLPHGGAGLAAELARVLGAVRAAYPEMEAVTVRAPWEPGALILSLEPELFEAVSRGLPAPGASASLCTADEELDALNAAVGLVAVQPFSFDSSVVVRFDPQRDILRAMLDYLRLDGVRRAAPNFILGDGPDIDARWVDGTWYLVFREASGDCPAGCIFSELHLFTERDAAVERFSARRPKPLAPFARILLEQRMGAPPGSAVAARSEPLSARRSAYAPSPRGAVASRLVTWMLSRTSRQGSRDSPRA